MNTDTICALATAPGGALGIIRVSGPEAIAIASSVCCGSAATAPKANASPVCCDAIATAPANTIHFVRITDDNGELIDEALVSIFRAPHSYTGEDSVEISCHGSSYILKKVLSLLVQHGCRMANPGEYTMRAYLNGKLDLSQAEAVADLIASTNRTTHQIAISQLRGGFSSELSRLREQLLKLTSLLELELDFSDHEDLEFADRTELLQLAQTIDAHILRLAKSFETGQALKQGIPVAIVGKTNVGKSTLLNALLKEDRAIVSDIHGTTRDTIEDTIDLNGITFRFIDTAGIRHTDDKIEQIGIDRTYQAIQRARIVLWLIDKAPTPSELSDMQTRCVGKSLLLVRNKSDLIPSLPASPSIPADTIPADAVSADIVSADAVPADAVPADAVPADAVPADAVPADVVSADVVSADVVSADVVSADVVSADVVSADVVPYAAALPQPPLLISAKTGQGLPALEAAIYAAVNIPEIKETDVIVTSTRHYQALTRAHAHLQRVLAGLGAAPNAQYSELTCPLPPDLLAEDLRLVLDTLAEITGGAITPQDTLNNIFSHFCVGK